MKRTLDHPQTVELDFAGEAEYRIVVEGELDPSTSDVVAGMRISSIERRDRKPLTTLTGKVSDQAELFGVLDTLFSLHLPILSVEFFNDD